MSYKLELVSVYLSDGPAAGNVNYAFGFYALVKGIPIWSHNM